MDKLKLFCLPHAGGSARVFMPWKRYISDFIELCPIELSGRGSRMNEPFYQTFEEGLNDVFQIIVKKLDDSPSPYALFGHSMGGMITYELSHRIQKIGFKNPMHIYFSGMKVPGAPTPKKDDKVSDEWIEERIRRLGGIPEELMNNKDVLKLFMPVLRSDFHMLETRQPSNKYEKLNTDITILNGASDDLVTNDSEKWQTVTSKKLNVHTFEGGHFFINQHVELVVKIINQTLESDGNFICT